jgi:hypothetical protein
VRLKLIACEVLYREIQAAVARSINRIDVEFLPKGLHDLGAEGMSGRLNEALGRVDESPYEAVLLGYALCSNGLVGLAAKSVPLVVPRAHDCITLFLGGKERYLDYFQRHPGTYFLTSGWIERGGRPETADPDSLAYQAGITRTYEELVAKYGEDNARYLLAQLGDPTRNYKRMTFIEMGIEPDDRFERHARAEAAQRGWEFEKLAGDMSLIQGLLDGPWDAERFLVVPPGWRISPNFDESIIKSELLPS